MQDSTSPSRQSKIHFVPDVDHAPRKSAARQRRSSAPVYLTPMRKPYLFPSGASTSGSDPVLGVFSDEYDLYPRILQDVQRALKLKAKHEAVLKQKTRLSSTPDPFLPLDALVRDHPRQGIGTPLFPRNVVFANNSDVDFGPSVGSNNAIVEAHPVPSSLDNGVTLDWSGVGSGGDKLEKRWPLSVKRKGKGSIPHLHILVQQQENAHDERQENIRKQLSSSTLHKAHITKDQLTRRYDLLTNPSRSHAPLSLAEVVRWYGSQNSDFKAAIEQAEPPNWLKHLQKKRKSTTYSSWRLTARVIEEYIHTRDGFTVPSPTSNEYIQSDLPSRRSLSPPGTHLIQVTSRGSSHISFDPSLSKTLSHEGLPSFEPLTRSTHDSFDILSRRSGESGYSSTRSKSPNGKRWPEDLPRRVQRRLTREGEGINTARASSSDISIAKDGPFDSKGGTSPSVQVIVTAGSDSQIPIQEEKYAAPYSTGGSSGDVGKIGGQRIHHLAPWMEHKRPKRISLEMLRQEYEAKARLLEEATAQNHRIRQLLNRVSIVVKEYDATQANALAPLGNCYQLQRLPREFLEAFSHDPAAVTGPTRRLRGYKAVDDIHNRLMRQRAICKEFLFETAQRPAVDVGSILRDPAIALNNSLESLQQCKMDIQFKAKDVAELLRKVQDIHTKVKVNYNHSLSHTSAVYPELSIIVGLEESYKDQYQQFWEIGMDALTFILDSVTPFWRTYGKTIGEDIRDFLIIPLYRNEFTGEAKRYPITCVPRRSLRHWLALALLYLSTATVTFISTRIAITLVTHGGLKSIPYESIRWIVLPFFWITIVIQWLIVLVEFIVLFLEIVVTSWWLGWLIKVFT